MAALIYKAVDWRRRFASIYAFRDRAMCIGFGAEVLRNIERFASCGATSLFIARNRQQSF